MQPKTDSKILMDMADALSIASDPNQSFAGVEYQLRMLWLGRYDKLSLSAKPALCAMTEIYLGTEPGYEPPASGVVLMQDVDHRVMADKVLRQFFRDIEGARAGTESKNEPDPKAGLINQWFADNLPKVWGRWWASWLMAKTFCTKWLSQKNPEFTRWQHVKIFGLCLALFLFAGKLPITITIKKPSLEGADTRVHMSQSQSQSQVNQSLLNPPEATLDQLGLADANFGFPFEPQYCAMDDGLDRVGGCWHLFEFMPTFDPVSLSWQSEGDAWEIGLDDTENLEYTPEFQRRVKAGFSLVKVVKVAAGEPCYQPSAYMS